VSPRRRPARAALWEAVATVGPIGRLPGAPGSFASVAAIPLAWALHAAGGFWLMGPATVAIAALGWYATVVVLAERGAGPEADPEEIVVDEVAGMMLALWPLSLGLTILGSGPEVFPWPGWVAGFLVFRFLDIAKPWPVSAFDRMHGARGVMLDDLAAGAITAILMLVAAGVAHGWV
jgi:phosphatidylglycerophosphatase A